MIAISHWIRRNQGGKKPPYIDSILFDDLMKNCELPNPGEQVENLIFWIGQTQKSLSSPVAEDPKKIYSLIGCIDYDDLHFIMRHMGDQNLFGNFSLDETQLSVYLSMHGWEYYEKLRKTNIVSKKAFMARKFDNPELDEVFIRSIYPSIEATGFHIESLKDNPKAGLIDDRMRVEIRRSKFLIADLTDANNGAYWEAGYAEGIGIPVIYICEKTVFEDEKKKPHFDTNHHLTIKWENTEEGLKLFSRELKDTIRATFPADAKMED